MIEKHLSTLDIERYVIGDLAAVDPAAIAGHLSTCSACAAAMTREAQFEQRIHEVALARQVGRGARAGAVPIEVPRLRPRLASRPIVVVAAAAVAFVIVGVGVGSGVMRQTAPETPETLAMTPAAPLAGASRSHPAPTTAQRSSGPDPTRRYSVDVTGDPVRGPVSAPVTIVVFGDFACPWCRRISGDLTQLVHDYKGAVRVVWKDFLVHGERARIPALAACAADRQGKFWEMHDAIFADPIPPPDRSDAERAARMRELAATLGLDLARFDRDVAGASCRDDLDADHAVGESLDLQATPSFFINGQFSEGARPIETYRAAIDAELGRPSGP